MLSKLKFYLKNVKTTLKFYWFLWSLGVLKEYYEAVVDNSGEYKSVLKRLNEGTPSSDLIASSFSFARQTYLRYSKTDWWSISIEWFYRETKLMNWER